MKYNLTTLCIALLVVLSFFACTKKENAKPAVEATRAAQAETQVDESAPETKKFTFHPDKTKLRWTAFKTPEKVGVNGSFDSIAVTDFKSSDVLSDVLEGAKFLIKTSSMKTGDDSRDAKIKALFFGNMSSPDITGSFGKFENEHVPVTIKMNGNEVTKDFLYTYENNKVVITGSIDIIKDFAAQQSFDLLHDACNQLHQGKTWTDVSIEITSEF